MLEKNMRRFVSIIFLSGMVTGSAFAMGERYDDKKTVVNEHPPKKEIIDLKAGGKTLDDGTSRIEKSDRFEEDKVERERDVLPRTNPADLVTEKNNSSN
jgi:hypothetical protein